MKLCNSLPPLARHLADNIQCGRCYAIVRTWGPEDPEFVLSWTDQALFVRDTLVKRDAGGETVDPLIERFFWDEDAAQNG